MENNNNGIRILVAPLNWGLGHATRCIPLIKELLNHNFEPVIASDGFALRLLEKEFPTLKHVELPSYNIRYPKRASYFKFKFLKDVPHLLKTIKKEKRLVKELVKSYDIRGIISDNRFGVRHPDIPSVFITHQLRVLSGRTTWISSKLHQRYILKFDECWVPDYAGSKNLSGALGHAKNLRSPVIYIGPLSRFEHQLVDIKYNLLVLLSGPEPQRSMLEEKLLQELKTYTGQVLFVKGKVETEQVKTIKQNIIFYNYMTSRELDIAMHESELILSRSGYTTIMDLAKLEKKAFFIPTPGQFEQEYLAKKLDADGITPYSEQDDFKLQLLDQVKTYKGFQYSEYDLDYSKLFNLFKGERKFTTDI